MSPDRSHRRRIGARGEQLAAEYLREEGWTILERNFTCEIGELDIVARRTDSLGEESFPLVAFVEVKSRADDADIPPERSVTRAKRRKLVNLAKFYLIRRELDDVSSRFDIVTVDFTESPPELAHYPSAFDALGRVN